MNSIEKTLQETEQKLKSLQEKAKLEQEFAEQANARFERNLRAFEKTFPDIYQRFLDYVPNANFQLMVNADGSANIIDYDTQVPMYAPDPVTQVAAQVAQSLAHPELSQVDFSSVEHLEDEGNFVHVRVMQKIGQQYNEARTALEENRKVGKNIPSIVIFGVGLGYHLTPLQDATTASYITIFEPNEDYFYASLFCFDWADYLERVQAEDSYLYIGIGDSENEIYETLYKRAQHIGAFSVSNSFFYLHYQSQKIANLVEEIKLNFNQFFIGWGFFDDQLMSVAHTVGILKKSPLLLNQYNQWPKNVTDFPIFIVANGPSLDKDIEKIKAEHGKAVIVSCNSATTALINHGIVPDFHVALERAKETADFLEGVIAKRHRDQINLLVLNVMYPDTLDLFPWTGIALKGGEAGTVLFQLTEYVKTGKVSSTVGYSNPLVGNTALSFFCHLGFKNIYLFGVDNGYVDKEHHHSKASFYYDEDGESRADPISMGNEMRVPGNFGNTVLTEPFLYSGKEQMDRLLASFVGTNLACYNCSDGVKVSHTYPLHSQDLLLESSPFAKGEIIEKIKQEGFRAIEPLPLESMLEFEAFEQMCNTAIEILSEPVQNRNEAIVKVMAQLRYLNSFKADGRFAHLYMLIEGEALYINAVLISLLFNFGDELSIMPYFEQALAHWVDFLTIAPNEYRERWHVVSDHDYIFHDPSMLKH